MIVVNNQPSGDKFNLNCGSTYPELIAELVKKEISIVKKSGKSLSQLADVMKLWPQRLANVEVKYKDGWEENKNIAKVIKEVENRLAEQGRVFVRASGTEPVIRVMLEAKDEELLIELEKELVEVISKELNSDLKYAVI